MMGGVVVAVVAAAVALGLRFGEREPEWKGKKLSVWMERHLPSSAANPPYGSPGWLEAQEAIKAIGTNGIPTLLRMIGATENDLGARVRRLARKQRFVNVQYRHAQGLNEEAEYAFELLGEQAAAAVPGLIEIYKGARSRDSQRCAALSLGHIGRPAGAALPVLIADFGHTNEQVRFYAVSAVGKIGGEPAVVVTALRSALNDSYRATRWNALVGLTQFGRKAQAAIPDILEMHRMETGRGDKELVEQVELALWRIAPEKTPKVLVVETNSPAAKGELCVADIFMELEGERRRMIKEGAALPTQMQIWTNDPRGVVRLYRKSKEGEEVFLGGYEVQGLPPKPETVRAYVLVVVAEGCIYTCARDVENDRLLDVRRVE